MFKRVRNLLRGLETWWYTKVLDERKVECVHCDKDMGWSTLAEALSCHGYFLCSEKCYQEVAKSWGNDRYHTPWRLRRIHEMVPRGK